LPKAKPRGLKKQKASMDMASTPIMKNSSYDFKRRMLEERNPICPVSKVWLSTSSKRLRKGTNIKRRSS
jgi:hypothetical protein